VLDPRAQDVQAWLAPLPTLREAGAAVTPGWGNELERRQDAVESDGRRWAATMTDADWLAEGKCPACRGEGCVGRRECQPCGGTGEVVFCSVCGLVVEHGLIIRRGADKMHPACAVDAGEKEAAS
jgi:RecJ-like exonuclease